MSHGSEDSEFLSLFASIQYVSSEKDVPTIAPPPENRVQPQEEPDLLDLSDILELSIVDVDVDKKEEDINLQEALENATPSAGLLLKLNSGEPVMQASPADTHTATNEPTPEPEDEITSPVKKPKRKSKKKKNNKSNTSASIEEVVVINGGKEEEEQQVDEGTEITTTTQEEIRDEKILENKLQSPTPEVIEIVVPQPQNELELPEETAAALPHIKTAPSPLATPLTEISTAAKRPVAQSPVASPKISADESEAMSKAKMMFEKHRDSRLSPPATASTVPFQKPEISIHKIGTDAVIIPSHLLKAISILPGSKLFSHEELKGLKLESGIDCTQKEAYLSDEEFAKVFGKDRETFMAQPKWRQQLAKKAVGLW